MPRHAAERKLCSIAVHADRRKLNLRVRRHDRTIWSDFDAGQRRRGHVQCRRSVYGSVYGRDGRASGTQSCSHAGRVDQGVICVGREPDCLVGEVLRAVVAEYAGSGQLHVAIDSNHRGDWSDNDIG